MIENSDSDQIERLNSRIIELLRERDALVKALEEIAQRANESGTGEMGILDTIYAIHSIAEAALKGGA